MPVRQRGGIFRMPFYKIAVSLTFIFANLSEESKLMAIVYLSALRDKEIADGTDDTNSTKLA